MRGRLLGNLLSGRTSMVNFAVTNECNARCRHCSFHLVTEKRTVTLDEAKLAIDSLRDLGVGVVSITGGEPFMVPYLPEIVGHATSRGMVTFTGTNGSLTTEGMVRGLARAGVDAVWVSVDGTDPASFEEHRGIHGLTPKVVDTVDLLRRHRVRHYAICALHRGVLDIGAYIDFLQELGIERVKFDYPMTAPMSSSYKGYGEHECLSLTVEEREDLVAQIMRLKRKGSAVTIVNPTEGLRGFATHSRGERPRYGCFAGRDILYLDWNLDLYRCSHRGDPLGRVPSVDPSRLGLTDCDQCYYEGCRDYDSLFFLLDSLRRLKLLDGRNLEGLRTALELYRTGLV